MTLTAWVALIPFADAVIVAVPAPAAVTIPLAEPTVATAVLSLVNVIAALAMTLLLASRAWAVSVNVCPIDSVGAVFVIFT